MTLERQWNKKSENPCGNSEPPRNVFFSWFNWERLSLKHLSLWAGNRPEMSHTVPGDELFSKNNNYSIPHTKSRGRLVCMLIHLIHTRSDRERDAVYVGGSIQPVCVSTCGQIRRDWWASYHHNTHTQRCVSALYTGATTPPTVHVMNNQTSVERIEIGRCTLHWKLYGYFFSFFQCSILLFPYSIEIQKGRIGWKNTHTHTYFLRERADCCRWLK